MKRKEKKIYRVKFNSYRYPHIKFHVDPNKCLHFNSVLNNKSDANMSHLKKKNHRKQQKQEQHCSHLTCVCALCEKNFDKHHRKKERDRERGNGGL